VGAGGNVHPPPPRLRRRALVQLRRTGEHAQPHDRAQRRAEHRLLRPRGIRLLTLGARPERWGQLWRRLGARGDADAPLSFVLGHYGAGSRAYHDLRHLDECLALFDEVAAAARRPDEVEAALWFHDVIYDPDAGDNEERSAALAEELLGRAGVRTEHLAEFRRLILATGHRGVRDHQDDAALVCDIDLAIFGSDPARFDEYERDIRREYAFVPEGEFRRRRAQILEGFMTRPTVYATPWFIERLETRARANLGRSITALRSVDPPPEAA
jgi:predicted metal-dependent HD superfamily phosphohydrolase